MIKPPFDKCGLLLVEHFGVEGNDDVLQDIQSNFALTRPLVSVSDDVDNRTPPTSIARLQGKVCHRHRKPFFDHAVVLYSFAA